MSTLTHPLQLSEKDHDRRLRRSRRHCQRWRQKKSPRFADDTDGLAGEKEELAKLHERLDKASHSLRHGDQCREDQADDKKTPVATKQRLK